MPHRYTTVDLFAGAGGLSLGFHLAGFVPMAVVEYSSQSLRTYERNLGHPGLRTFCSDMRDPSIPAEIKRHLSDQGVETLDLLTAGLPCETFSVARRKKPTDAQDYRFTLYKDVLRYVEALQPRFVVIENVKQLKTARDGVIFSDLTQRLRELGYQTTDWVLRAVEYGVPQIRERLVILGVQAPLALPKLPPITHCHPDEVETKSAKLGRRLCPWVSIQDALSDLPDLGEFYVHNERPKETPQTTDYALPLDQATDYQKLMRVGLLRGHIYDRLENHHALRHSPEMVHRLSYIQPGQSLKDLMRNPDVPAKLKPKKAYNIRCRRPFSNQPSYTVTAHCVDELLHYEVDRQITPREAARLQSFPDWFVITGPRCGHHGDAQIQDQYEQMGDAVPPLLAQAVARQVLASIHVSEQTEHAADAAD